MNYIQKQLEHLKSSIVPQSMESDFTDFWESEVHKLRSIPLQVRRELIDLPYKTFKAYEITFNTHDSTEVTAYFCVPNTYNEKRMPCVAVYHGGGGSYGVFPDIVATGVCTFSMDGRSQGGRRMTVQITM